MFAKKSVIQVKLLILITLALSMLIACDRPETPTPVPTPRATIAITPPPTPFVTPLPTALVTPLPTPFVTPLPTPQLVFEDAGGTPLGNQTFRVFCHEQATYNITNPTPREQMVSTDAKGQVMSWLDGCRYVTALQLKYSPPDLRYAAYLTSWNPGDINTQDAATGTITMTTNSLVVFNPLVSLAWEPAKDSQIVSLSSSSFSASLIHSFTEASSYLYNVSNGQMIFGDVAIYTNGEKWDKADFRMLADNDRRPAANVGGMVETAVKHPQPPGQTFKDLIFYPGHITLGRGWSNKGPDVGLWGDQDGWRTLVHEWGHYALFLYDEYLALDNTPASCACDHENSSCISSIMDWHYDTNRTELWGTSNDNPICQQTQQWAIHQQSDWQTIGNWFDLQKLPPPVTLTETLASGTQPTFASYLVKIKPLSVSEPPTGEPVITVQSPDTAGQQLAQIYTMERDSQRPNMATNILYQGSTLLYNDGKQLSGQLTLLGIQEDNHSLYVGVNQFLPNKPYQADALTYSGAFGPTVPLKPNMWQPQLDVAFTATMQALDTQTAVITQMALSLQLDQATPGAVFAQLCAPGNHCYGPWEIADGSIGQHNRTITLADPDIPFPTYSILRLWVETQKTPTPYELLRWIEIGRPGSGPGGGCAHAPVQDGNQTRTLGMEIEPKWETDCSGLVAYMPVTNNMMLQQTAVPDSIQGFVSPPIQVQDIPLNSSTCSAKDSSIIINYDELAVCKTAASVSLLELDPNLLGADEAERAQLIEVCDKLMDTKASLETLRLAHLRPQVDRNGPWELLTLNPSRSPQTPVNGDGIFAIVLVNN